MNSRYLIQPDHPKYLRAAKREASNWGRILVQTVRAVRPRDHPLVKSYLARLISGQDDAADWLNWLQKQVEPFESALSLGSGNGPVEEAMLRAGLFKRLEVVDISGTAVENFQHRMLKAGIGSVISSRIADLNFIELPEKGYDFILAHTSLHHIINLEHLLEQVRRALVPEGLFLVYDFVGPSGWQWSYDSMQEVNRALELSRGRHPELKIHTVKRPNHKKVKSFSPFESVRSDEILGLLRIGFEPRLEILTDRLLFIILNYGIEMGDWKNPVLNIWLQEMIDWEDSMKTGGELPPYTLWGAYYPGTRPLPNPKRWTEEEIERRIGVSRFDLKGKALDFLDRLPFRDRMVASWMKHKKQHRKY